MAREHIEAALGESESFIRLILNSSAEAFYALDRDGVTILCNATFLAIMGFEREEDALGRKLHDVIHHTRPDGSRYHVADCPIYGCAGHGVAAHVSDECFYRLDGTPVPVEYWARPIIVDGEHRGAICTFFDISERRVAEAARQEAEDRLRALNAELEHRVIERTQVRGKTWQITPDLLGALNPEGYFETSNPAWQTVLGWSEEDVARMPIWELLHPDDVERTRVGFALTQTGQPAIRFPNRYRCKDGNYRWISWVGIPDDGLVYCTGRDITDEMEETQAKERLLVSEANLANERAVAGLREEFIAVLGHDLRNPLAALDAGTRMLMRETPSEKARTIGAMMQQSVVRMSGLIDNVLDFARGRLGGAFHITRQSTFLAPVLDQVVAELQSAWPQRAIQTTFILDEAVNCDASRIAQLLSNLLGNALAHGSPTGAIEVRATARDGVLNLVVSNPSPEIPAATLERLFQPFVRGEGAPGREGLGLGLFIASQIAQAHRGRISPHWAEGRTIFTFEMSAI